MVYVKTGDYVVYRTSYGLRRRGVVTFRDWSGIWIRSVAECHNRRWYDRVDSSGFKYKHGVVLGILKPHIAMQYKLKGL